MGVLFIILSFLLKEKEFNFYGLYVSIRLRPGKGEGKGWGKVSMLKLLSRQLPDVIK